MIDPLFPILWSVVVALVVLAVLVFLEFRRKLRFLVLRIIAQILLVTSVFLLVLRPSVATSKTEKLLLLTQGYDQTTLDSLTSLTPVSISSPNELPKLNGVSIITGNGLPSWALNLLPSKNYKFIASRSPQGITGVEFDEHIYAHRRNEIRGTYNGDASLITLRGPGGVEDSVRVQDGKFTLSFFSKAPGRFNYQLITNTEEETLPLIIEPERSLNIIFINNYPTFETRYLKNFLASKGHSLAVRTQVSRGLYRFEFTNRPPSNFQSLTSVLLDDADLVVIDEPSWSSISSGDQKNLRAAISDGLGVIILPETGKKQLITFKPTDQKDTVRVSLGKTGSMRLPALSLEAAGTTPLLSSTDRVVNGYAHSGSGKIGYQLLMETYQLGLQGKADAYSALWVPLLERSARTAKNDFKLKVTSPFPYYENEPLSFDIISSGSEPKLKIDNIDFPLIEDVYIDDLWHGTTWLNGSRWHDFTLDSTTTAVHVAKQGTWNSISATNNRKATALHARQENNTGDQSTVKDDKAIKIFLFAIFILSAGFLWLAPKL